jgi:opacity protein-like surface antigen
MRKLLYVLSLSLLLPLAARAQDAPRAEIFGGYSYLRTDDRLDLDLHGWNASVAGNFNKWFGLKADFSGHYDDIQITPGVRADISAHLFLGGAQFTARQNEHFQPFVHVMIGAARAHSSARTTTGRVSTSDTEFAFVAGGGLDIKIIKPLALRLVQTDYVFIHDDIDSTHNFRLSTGLVLRLGDQ